MSVGESERGVAVGLLVCDEPGAFVWDPGKGVGLTVGLGLGETAGAAVEPRVGAEVGDLEGEDVAVVGGGVGRSVGHTH
jgi:hypothetical protein